MRATKTEEEVSEGSPFRIESTLLKEYAAFRSSISQKKVVVTVSPSVTHEWTIYDAGPRSITCPLVFLPPVGGTAEAFFLQLMTLSRLGYRVISVNYPVIWSVNEWVASFSHLLDALRVDMVHLFGASFGGFLAQKYAEHTATTSMRVRSLILCNTFVDTQVIRHSISARGFWLLPLYVLRKSAASHCTSTEGNIVASYEFMQKQLESLTQQELASRLTLSCDDDYVRAHLLAELDITIVDVCDDSGLPAKVREETYKCYPQAKLAQMKLGGDFPFLSRAEEVTLFCQVHCKSFLPQVQSDAANLLTALVGAGRFTPCLPTIEPLNQSLGTNETSSSPSGESAK